MRNLLLYSGDLTIRGYRIEFYRQLMWLEMNRHRYKYGIVLVLGNHELYAEENFEAAVKDCEAAGVTLLHNSGIEIAGLKFWGSPHTPHYHSWAFMLKKRAIKAAWRKYSK